VSRRPYATAEKFKKLENKIGLMRRRIDELDGLSSKLGTAIDEINEIKL
jgi:hypothetical protein